MVFTIRTNEKFLEIFIHILIYLKIRMPAIYEQKFIITDKVINFFGLCRKTRINSNHSVRVIIISKINKFIVFM